MEAAIPCILEERSLKVVGPAGLEKSPILSFSQLNSIEASVDSVDSVYSLSSESRSFRQIMSTPSTDVKIGRGRGEFDERNFPGDHLLRWEYSLTLLPIRQTDASSADQSFV